MKINGEGALNRNGNGNDFAETLGRTRRQQVDGARIVGAIVLVLAGGAGGAIAADVLQRAGKAKPGTQHEYPE